MVEKTILEPKSDVSFSRKPLFLELARTGDGWFIKRTLEGQTLSYGPSEHVPQYFGNQEELRQIYQVLHVEGLDQPAFNRWLWLCRVNLEEKSVNMQEPKKGGVKGREEDKIPIKCMPFMELPDGVLVEEGFDGQQTFFLCYDPSTGSVEKKSIVELDDFNLMPIDNDEVRCGTVLLPSDVEEYNSEDELTLEIREYLNRWHEPPDVLSRTLDVFYAYLSHIYDLIPQLPYRRYLAPWGKGKSAWLETLGWVCYRGLVLAGSDTDKSVVRKMNNWRGTALIDEADFGDSTLYAFLTKILNIGYDKKTGYYNRSDEYDPNKVLSYCVYAPKLLATREKYKDLALESRCLTTIGRQNARAVPLFRMDRFLDEAQHLRNKLMLWRFRNYYRIKNAAKQLEMKDIAKQVYDGAEGVSSRVKQVILPLWLIGGDNMKQTLTEMAKVFDNLLKIEDPDYLLELQARAAVKEMVEKNSDMVNVRNVVNVLIGEAPLSEDEEPAPYYYEIQLSHISKTILKQQGVDENEVTSNDVQHYSKNLKGIFESNLGFKIRIGAKRSRVVLIPSKWLEDAEKPKDLTGFLEEPGGSYKDLHNVTNVHQEDCEKSQESDWKGDTP